MKKVTLFLALSCFLSHSVFAADFYKKLTNTKIKKAFVGATVLGLGAWTSWRFLPKIVESTSSNPVINKLGYDPGISIDQASENNAEINLFQQGFGDGNDVYNDCSGYYKKTKCVTCNPCDFVTNNSGFLGFLYGVRKTSFGQEGDAMVICYAMDEVLKNNYCRINLFGHSRGGAGVSTALCMLQNFDNYQRDFKKLGIDKKRAALLLSKVQKVHLANPWLHTDKPFKTLSQNVVGGGFFAYLASLFEFFSKSSLTLATNYSFLKTQRYNTLKSVIEDNNRQFSITVDTAKKDPVVGNKYDNDLKKLAEDKSIKNFNVRLAVNKNRKVYDHFGNCMGTVNSHCNTQKSIQAFMGQRF